MIEKMRHAERRAEETYPPPSDRASVPLGQRNVQLRAGYVQGYLDRDLEEPFDEQRPDPRAVMHAKCNCVPSLGPAHCHKCGENQGSPVPWTECTAVRITGTPGEQMKLMEARIEKLEKRLSVVLTGLALVHNSTQPGLNWIDEKLKEIE